MMEITQLQLPDQITVHDGTFQQAIKMLQANPAKAIAMPLQHVPVDRPNNIIASALLPRLDPAYYLLNKLPTKNLSLLGSTQKLYYNRPEVEKFIYAINTEIPCEKIPVEELGLQKLAIHTGENWSQEHLVRLSPEEFVPNTSEGIYVVLCLKDQLKLRKFVGRFHDDDCYDCSNIERQVQQQLSDNSDIDFITCYVSKDDRANFHGTVVFLHDGEMIYITLSQSTTYGFVDDIVAKLQLIS